MYPKPIQKLIEIFMKFPGIGPRQAIRFTFFVLKENGAFTEELVSTLKELREKVSFCRHCFRSTENQENGLCHFCRDPQRDQKTIAVMEKESDMQNLEKTSLYRGVYHILGGVISLLDTDSPKKLHLKEMHRRVKNILEQNEKCEVILATNSTTEGDTTALYIERILTPFKEQYADFKISRLGRGLSLGSELEYADEVTLKNALTNRK